MKRLCIALTAAAVLTPTFGAAQTCQQDLAQLQASYGGAPMAQLTAAIAQLQNGACPAATRQAALSQAAGQLAGRAQKHVAAGGLAQAEQVLAQAPALHWAVQAVRGDIASVRKDRAEAAQMYTAAFETITDPALTPANPRLVPVAQRLARLAQENMMLSGSLDATVTRGGQAKGALKSALRGIRIEKAGTFVSPTPAPVPAPAKPALPAQPAQPATQYPAPAKDLYPDAAPDRYAIADQVAKAAGPLYVPIRFAFGSDQLDPHGQREAATVARFLQANGLGRITLVGHTDEIGAEATNLDLSLRRAQTVKHFLKAKGVHATIHVIGKGEAQPPKLTDAALYSDEERRQIARRVELVLHE